MGMKIVSGEDFLPSDSILHNDLNFIATQDLQQKTGIPAGSTLDFFVWGMNVKLKDTSTTYSSPRSVLKHCPIYSVQTGNTVVIFCLSPTFA